MGSGEILLCLLLLLRITERGGSREGIRLDVGGEGRKQEAKDVSGGREEENVVEICLTTNNKCQTLLRFLCTVFINQE